MLKEKMKSLLGPVLLLLVILAGVLAVTFMKEPEEEEEIVKVNSYEGGEQDIVLENDKLKFVMDPTTTQFSITVKSSGEIWYSNPQDADQDSVALNTDKDNLQSTLLLTYSTINGVDTLYSNYKYSMQSHIYNIDATDDMIKINYSIGEVEKEFYIPTVLTEERWNELIEVMEVSESTMVKDYYKKYDINDLDKKDDKDALLEQYPILADSVIYVLREGVKDNLKSKFEGFFENAGYTMEEYQEDKELYAGEAISDKPVFNVTMEYSLDEDDLIVNIPMDEIQCKSDYPLLNLNVLPFFGAGGTKDEGYLLVPEGGGAIINFNNGKTAQNSYYASMYGWDMAQGRDSLVHETCAYYGAFGIAKGDSSFLCMLEDGASYASIQADISGRNNSYNYANAQYNIMHREQCDVADKYNGEMFTYVEDIPKEDIRQRYRFVDSNEYSDMAGAYRNYLTDKYGSAFEANVDAEVPVTVEVVGAVDKIEQICGVPVRKPLKVTSYSEAEELLKELKAAGMNNVSVKLSGWMNGGIKQSILKKVKLISRLGSKKDLESLIAYANDNEIALYLDGITNYAYNSKVTDGFLQFRDAARMVSKEKAELSEFSTIWYGEVDWKDPYYLLKPSVILDMMENLAGAASKYEAAGVSLRDTGYALSADYNEKQMVTREEAKKQQINELQKIKDQGLGVMTNMGNDYTLGQTDFITNMDLNGSVYTILDETVPFYQMAIHGFVNYAGEPLNLTGDSQEELLKSAEYGAALSFTYMKEDPTELQNTYYTQYFGANYDGWKDKMTEIYSRYSQDLSGIFAQQMTAHDLLDEGVTSTTYADGTIVYVNYNYEDYTTEDGLKLPARDYLVDHEGKEN